MRKNTAILALGALVLLGASAWAEAVVVTGDVGYGVNLDLTASPVTATEGYYADLYFSATVDDATTGYASLYYDSAEGAVFGDAYVTSNIAKYFKLDESGLGLSLKAGYDSSSDNSYGYATDWGSEDVAGSGVGTTWILSGVASFKDFVNLKLAIAPAGTNDWMAGVYSSRDWGFGTLSVEAFYDGNSLAIGEGFMNIDGQWAKSFSDVGLTVAGGFKYDLGAESMAWGAGVGVTYKSLAGARVGTYGNSTDALAGLVADISFEPIELIDVYSGLCLSFAEGTDMFAALDSCVVLNVASADIRLGYLVSSSQTYLYAPAASANGGPYVEVELSF